MGQLVSSPAPLTCREPLAAPPKSLVATKRHKTATSSAALPTAPGATATPSAARCGWLVSGCFVSAPGQHSRPVGIERRDVNRSPEIKREKRRLHLRVPNLDRTAVPSQHPGPVRTERRRGVPGLGGNSRASLPPATSQSLTVPSPAVSSRDRVPLSKASPAQQTHVANCS